MMRLPTSDTTIIALSAGIVCLGYLRIRDWMPELGFLGNLATGDVPVFAGLEIKYYSILAACTLSVCWALYLRLRRTTMHRSSRHGMSGRGL